LIQFKAEHHAHPLIFGLHGGGGRRNKKPQLIGRWFLRGFGTLELARMATCLRRVGLVVVREVVVPCA